MELLKKEYSKNGYLLQQVLSRDRLYIYQLKWKETGDIHGYEVFEKRIGKEKAMFDKMLPERELYPSNEDFGKWAWSVNTMDRALEVGIEIENGTRVIHREVATN